MLVNIQVNKETIDSGNTELLLCEARDWVERWAESQEMGVIFIDKEDNFIGKANYDRFNQCAWWQKAISYFSYKYKRQFIDIQPFGINKN